MSSLYYFFTQVFYQLWTFTCIYFFTIQNQCKNFVTLISEDSQRSAKSIILNVSFKTFCLNCFLAYVNYTPRKPENEKPLRSPLVVKPWTLCFLVHCSCDFLQIAILCEILEKLATSNVVKSIFQGTLPIHMSDTRNLYKLYKMATPSIHDQQGRFTRLPNTNGTGSCTLTYAINPIRVQPCKNKTFSHVTRSCDSSLSDGVL
jgi:hypothetical protein